MPLRRIPVNPGSVRQVNPRRSDLRVRIRMVERIRDLYMEGRIDRGVDRPPGDLDGLQKILHWSVTNRVWVKCRS